MNRKRILTIVAVMTLLFVCAPWSCARSTFHKLTKWSSWASSADPNGYVMDAVDSVAGESGRVAMIKSINAAQPGCFQALFVNCEGRGFAGKKVQFKARVKTENVKGAVRIWLSTDRHDQNLTLTASDLLENSSDWQELTVVGFVPSNAEKIMVGFILEGGGIAYFANPEFKVVYDDAPVSNINPTTRAYLIKSYQLKTEPRNLLFNDLKNTYNPAKNSIHNWSVHTDPDFEVVDKNIAYKGVSSVRIVCNAKDSAGFASIYQIFSPEKYLGKRVRLSGFVKTKDIKDWAGLLMQVDDGEHLLGFDAMESRPVKGTQDWKKCSVVLDVPPSSKKIKIGFLQAGSGTSWLSNLAFGEALPKESVTGKPVNGERLPARKWDSKPELGFE